MAPKMTAKLTPAQLEDMLDRKGSGKIISLDIQGDKIKSGWVKVDESKAKFFFQSDDIVGDPARMFVGKDVIFSWRSRVDRSGTGYTAIAMVR